MTYVICASAFLFGCGIRLGRRHPPPLYAVVAAAAVLLTTLDKWDSMSPKLWLMLGFFNIVGAALLGGVVGAMFPETEESSRGGGSSFPPRG